MPTHDALALLAFALLPACAAPLPAASPARSPVVAAPAPTAPAPDARAAAVDRVLASIHPDAPGCSVAVSERGVVVLARGYGLASLEYGVAVTPATPFHAASLSKQFTALSIMLLAREGKLSLDDDVRRYLPDLPSFGRVITLRHLLHHTSGLRDQWALLRLAGWRADDAITDADVLSLVQRQRELNFAPGTEFLYSNTGYTLLAHVVSRVSGRSLRDFTAARVFGPLGLSSTQFHDDHTRVVPGRAHGYARRDGAYHAWDPVFDTVGPSSLFTSALDLVRWSDALADDHALGDGLLARMLEPGRLDDGLELSYLAGLQLGNYRGLSTLEHGGADAGFRGHLVRFPEQRVAIACLCNSAESKPQELTRAVADVYLAARLAPPSRGPAAVAAPVDPARAGVYWSAARDELIELSVKDGKLSSGGALLAPRGDDRFQLRGAEIRFRPRPGAAPVIERTAPNDRAVIFEPLVPAIPTHADLEALAGVYRSDELDVSYTLAADGAALALRPWRGPPRVLAAVSADTFHADEGGLLHVVRGPDGRATGFTLSTGRVRRLRFVRR